MEGSSVRQFIEQRFRFPQVRSVEPFGEPAIDLDQQVVSLGALALLLPEVRQAGSGAEFERLGLLAAGNIEGVVEAGLRLSVIARRLLQQQRALEAMDLGL